LGKLSGRTLDNWSRIVVDENKPARSLFIGAADVNQDNHVDLFTGGWWYQNPGTNSPAWQRRLIGSPFNNYAISFDFDRDGDIDLLGTRGVGSEANSSFAWAENDGSGSFTVRTNIQNGDGDFLQGVTVNQFEKGKLAVGLSWHVEGKGVQILQLPSNPKATTWTLEKISNSSQDEGLSSGDIDKDGDKDLLLGTKWLENIQGGWNLRTLSSTNELPDRNVLADINKDGRLDVVIGFETVNLPGKLAWYEQPSTATGLWIEHVVDNPIGPMSLDVKDMDGDLDLDIVVGEHNTSNPQSARLLIYENLDGSGGSWKQHVVFTGDEHHDGAQVVDIDGDGDMDIISIGWTHNRVLLYVNQAAENETVNISAVQDIASEEEVFPLSRTSTPTGISSKTPSPTFTFTTTEKSELVNHDRSLILHYTFDEDQGNVVNDISGYRQPVNLLIKDVQAVKWIPKGIKITSPTIILSDQAPNKLYDSLISNGEISVSIWLKADNLSQNGPARILSISKDIHLRNFTVGQEGDTFDIRLRTTDRSENGRPSTASPASSLQSDVTHLVYVRDNEGNAKIYINGKEVTRTTVGGRIDNWDTEFFLMLGNELTMDRPWLGELYDLKIFGIALQAVEISKIFAEKVY
jgi:hypothetical protein